MSAQQLLGRLSGLHRMLVQLVQSVPEADAYSSFGGDLAPVAWYLGRATYIENYWLREVVEQDSDITDRVREIFTPGSLPALQQWQLLPPRDHLLNWVLELQDENIMRLANARLLPPHPLLEGDRLHWLITQEVARIYEQMLQVLTWRQLRQATSFRSAKPLKPQSPDANLVQVAQGHYRIGAKSDPSAFDNEQPPQIVELSSFRIQQHPVSNAAWLSFMTTGGYQDPGYWSREGWERLAAGTGGPAHWRKDAAGNWHGIGLNGPFELMPEEPVTGISHDEASAFANWLAQQGGEQAGAVVQHEYQWEVATRTRAITDYGRAWEWCANLFQPYSGYRTPEISEAATAEFDGRHYSLRGASLHTQPCLRRTSLRNQALPQSRELCTGVRLVFPPR